MPLPARHRTGALAERMPTWGEPMVEEFDELFDRMARFMESASVMPSIVGRSAWAPAADMYETEGAYVVEAEFPGVTRDKIQVELTGHELIIKAEVDEREYEGVLRRSTRRAGSFEYRTTLPTDVKSDEVSAQLSEGVLTVTVPKAQTVTPRQIEVTVKP